MPHAFTFDLLAPEARITKGPAGLVVLPGEMGEFGVGPGHEAIVATLTPGVVRVYDAPGAPTAPPTATWFVDGGYADVKADRCTVMADGVTPLEALDRAALEQTLRNLTDDMQLAETELERYYIARYQAAARAKLRILDRHGKRGARDHAA